MKVTRTALPGVTFVDGEPVADERGFFVRTWDREPLSGDELPQLPSYGAVSYNPRRYTLRGMHFQVSPHGETKIVRCVRGAVFDVAVDVRRGSESFGRWAGTKLTADTFRSVVIAPGHAHGFLTLEPDSAVEYLIGGAYDAGSAAGIRWDDPLVGIEWPHEPELISDRDLGYAPLSP